MTRTMGIDIGSSACKCIILQDGAEVVAKTHIPLGTGTDAPDRVYAQALEAAGITAGELGRTIATGYGRLSFERADGQKSELNCHAAGVYHRLPGVRTVVDIGGQDIKVLSLNDKGILSGFVMNDKCAAGTGRFLEVMARVLNIPLGEMGGLSMQSDTPVSISNTCTVFAESEVISKLSAGVALADLVAGIHESVAKRVAGLVLRGGLRPEVALSGGVALNGGVAHLLGKELKCDIKVHPDCQFAGALGAALLAFRELDTAQ